MENTYNELIQLDKYPMDEYPKRDTLVKDIVGRKKLAVEMIAKKI